MEVKAILAAAAAIVALPLVVCLAVTSIGDDHNAAADTGLGGPPTTAATQDIPPGYLAWYQAAAATCQGLPWTVLAGIGKVETDHGRNTTTSSAGAQGPMQFEPATFAQYGVVAPGGANPPSIDDPADAIYTAAAMLCADGAKGGSTTGIYEAIYAYNHADWYVDDVLYWARQYGGLAVDAGTSQIAATAIGFAEAQLGKPYVLGAAGPAAWDCSALVQAAYATAGLHIGRTTFDWTQDGPVVALDALEPGDLLFSQGTDGTPTSPGHVAMYLGNGEEIEAPHTGDVVKIIPVPGDIEFATRPSALAPSAPTSSAG